MPPEAFLDMAEDRTVTFSDAASGAEIGVEQFLGRDRTLMRLSDGTCYEGEVELRGPRICFTYPEISDEPQCFWMVLEDGAAPRPGGGTPGQRDRLRRLH